MTGVGSDDSVLRHGGMLSVDKLRYLAQFLWKQSLQSEKTRNHLNSKADQRLSRPTIFWFYHFPPSAKSADVTLKSTTGLSWWPSYSGVMIIKLLLIALLMNHCLMCAASTQTVCICLVVGWCSEISWSISSRTTLIWRLQGKHSNHKGLILMHMEYL